MGSSGYGAPARRRPAGSRSAPPRGDPARDDAVAAAPAEADPVRGPVAAGQGERHHPGRSPADVAVEDSQRRRASTPGPGRPLLLVRQDTTAKYAYGGPRGPAPPRYVTRASRSHDRPADASRRAGEAPRLGALVAGPRPVSPTTAVSACARRRRTPAPAGRGVSSCPSDGHVAGADHRRGRRIGAAGPAPDRGLGGAGVGGQGVPRDRARAAGEQCRARQRGEHPPRDGAAAAGI